MKNNEAATFWQHLDILRWVILRSLGVAVVFAVVAFCLKDRLFAVVLAPRTSEFITFRWLGVEPFSIHLMNTGLTEQFMTHMRVAMYAGLLCAAPYIIYELFRFVSPGLYQNERRAGLWMVSSGYVMFMLGTLINYFLIFPLTVRFLGTYQVSPEVDNMLTLQSYTDTLISMCLVMGVIFELPVVCAILGKLGFLTSKLMTRYRRHAIVAILIVAAIITPTTDVFTLLIVSLPIWLLYEISILVVNLMRK
ncbi:twin-arginine translocase subunit TatC [Prevotella sp. E15-22]|uniref:twin-arginine translocase subunit TatC n=1 Tax=Prevotella sp. E15-22 TaxID=2937774 RepID=UPI0020473C1D|nr:twin-arginine translocase subunit TatC [Prevotella sp. E15-22]UPS45451.1 twin-arginine translocase subunit TatC [Prevotella sp. E15-22]